MKEKSNVKLKSNVMLQERTSGGGVYSAMPLEALIEIHPEWKDVRLRDFLPRHQQESAKKLAYLARKIIDVD